jgi:hypothetical protein
MNPPNEHRQPVAQTITDKNFNLQKDGFVFIDMLDDIKKTGKSRFKTLQEVNHELCKLAVNDETRGLFRTTTDVLNRFNLYGVHVSSTKHTDGKSKTATIIVDGIIKMQNYWQFIGLSEMHPLTRLYLKLTNILPTSGNDKELRLKYMLYQHDSMDSRTDYRDETITIKKDGDFEELKTMLFQFEPYVCTHKQSVPIDDNDTCYIHVGFLIHPANNGIYDTLSYYVTGNDHHHSISRDASLKTIDVEMTLKIYNPPVIQ